LFLYTAVIDIHALISYRKHKLRRDSGLVFPADRNDPNGLDSIVTI